MNPIRKGDKVKLKIPKYHSIAKRKVTHGKVIGTRMNGQGVLQHLVKFKGANCPMQCEVNELMKESDA